MHPKWAGPFLICGVGTADADGSIVSYQLELPKSWKISPWRHRNVLKKHQGECLISTEMPECLPRRFPNISPTTGDEIAEYDYKEGGPNPNQTEGRGRERPADDTFSWVDEDLKDSEWPGIIGDVPPTESAEPERAEFADDLMEIDEQMEPRLWSSDLNRNRSVPPKHPCQQQMEEQRLREFWELQN